MLNWPAKDPAATYDYRWEPPLDEGDKLATAAVTRITGDVVTDSQAMDDTGLTVVLSGGSVGVNVFRGVWTSVGGRSDDETIVLPVAEKPIIDTSNLYGTDDGFAMWLARNGHVLPASAPPSPVLRARGTAYVDSYEAYWTGSRTGGVMQELAWPRINATVNCMIAVASDVIPPPVVNAAYRAAWLEAETPGILAGPVSTPGSRVKRQRVEGAVEREFFDDGKAGLGSGLSFIDPLIDSALSAFICNQENAPFVWSLGC